MIARVPAITIRDRQALTKPQVAISLGLDYLPILPSARPFRWAMPRGLEPNRAVLDSGRREQRQYSPRAGT